jgi:hypothetical protein
MQNQAVDTPSLTSFYIDQFIMEAATPFDRDGNPIQQTRCPLCHRQYFVDGRAALCGHLYCLLCLKDLQLTASLQGQVPTCKLCYTDISDLQSVAFIPNRVLPLPNNASTRSASHGPTIGDVAALALSRSAANSRTHQAIPDLALPPPQPQLPRLISFQDTKGYASPHSLPYYQGHGLSSYQVVNPAPAIKAEKKVPAYEPLKGIAFYLKGDLKLAGEAKQIILNNGGRLTTGATKHTEYVILGANAKMTKSMQENGGTMLDEDGFWALIKEKVGDVHEQFHSLFEGGVSKEDGSDGSGYDVEAEEMKLKEELSRLEKRIGETKRKLEDIEKVKAVKKVKS